MVKSFQGVREGPLSKKSNQPLLVRDHMSTNLK